MWKLLDRFALTASAAASLLAACGGSQQPIGAPGTMPQNALLPPAPMMNSNGTGSSSEKMLHRFNGRQSYPYAGLIDMNGTLHGTTYGHGKRDLGSVYSISPKGVTTTLHRFNDATSLALKIRHYEGASDSVTRSV